MSSKVGKCQKMHLAVFKFVRLFHNYDAIIGLIVNGMFKIDSCIHGHYAYEAIWMPTVSEHLIL